MKKIALFFFGIVVFSAGVMFTDAAVHVNGYYRKNGTYVAPHYRSDPDGIVTNNWSYPGNTNPYTGVTAGGSVSGVVSSPSSYVASVPTTTYIENGYKYGTTLNCYYGYYANGGACNKIPDGASFVGGTLSCLNGYVSRGGKCITNTEDCKITYGNDVVGVAGTSGNSSCSCSFGHAWNSDQTACIVPLLSQTASTVSSGPSHEVLMAQIKALLETIAGLQEQLAKVNAMKK